MTKWNTVYMYMQILCTIGRNKKATYVPVAISRRSCRYTWYL